MMNDKSYIVLIAISGFFSVLFAFKANTGYNDYRIAKECAQDILAHEVITLDPTDSLMPEHEGKFVYTNGCLHSDETLRVAVCDANQKPIDTICRDGIRLYYKEERLHRSGRSSTWKVKYKEDVCASTIQIGKIPVNTHVLKDLTPDSVVFEEKLEHDYRVEVKSFPNVDVSCVALCKDGYLAKMDEDAPFFYTRGKASVETVLTKVVDGSKKMPVLYVVFCIIFSLTFCILLRQYFKKKNKRMLISY